MGFICGVLLMYMGEDDAFLMLVSLLENFSMAGLFMLLARDEAKWRSEAQPAAAQQVLLSASEAARDELASSPCTSYRARQKTWRLSLMVNRR